MRCCNACAEPEKRLATPPERRWLSASGAYHSTPPKAVLLSVRATCNVLQHFCIPADQIKAVQSLNSASAMTQAQITSLPPVAASQPDSSPTPGKQQRPPPLREPLRRLASASKQPAAASKRQKLSAHAATPLAPPAMQGQMGVEASRATTVDLQSLHHSGPSSSACHEELAVDASPGHERSCHGLPSQDVSDRPRPNKPGPCTAHGKAFSSSTCSAI